MSLNTFSPAHTHLQPKGLNQLSQKSSVVVVGAGAFGGWTALYLRRKGLKVTLVDAWGAGNVRGSSGDESRIIRATYGSNEFYFDLCLRSMKLWKEHERHWNKKLFYNKGVIWFCYEESNILLDESVPIMRKHGMEFEYLSALALKEKFPFINTENIHHAYFDPTGGFLKARESCQAVKEAFVKEGGEFMEAQVKPGQLQAGKLSALQLSDGSIIQADAYLFACGAWLGQLFPDVLGKTITCTKQEVFYFGMPSEYESLPPWVDADGKDFYYGIPSHHGFKIGVDRRGADFDPMNTVRVNTPEVLERVRGFLGYRFPGLQNAPLLNGRVCPYENSPDGNFIFEKHPEADNVIFLGGGSGHGFKHGPALGELVANTLSPQGI